MNLSHYTFPPEYSYHFVLYNANFKLNSKANPRYMPDGNLPYEMLEDGKLFELINQRIRVFTRLNKENLNEELMKSGEIAAIDKIKKIYTTRPLSNRLPFDEKVYRFLANLPALRPDVVEAGLEEARIRTYSLEKKKINAILPPAKVQQLEIDSFNFDDDSNDKRLYNSLAVHEAVKGNLVSFTISHQVLTQEVLDFVLLCCGGGTKIDQRSLGNELIIKELAFMNGNLMEDELCKVLALILDNTKLRRLTLHGMKLPGKGMQQLITPLIQNKYLAELDLTGSILSEENCQAIADIIKGNKSLSILRYYDPLKPGGREEEEEAAWETACALLFKFIFRALPFNTTLECFYFNPLLPGCYPSLLFGLQTSKTFNFEHDVEYRELSLWYEVGESTSIFDRMSLRPEVETTTHTLSKKNFQNEVTLHLLMKQVFELSRLLFLFPQISLDLRAHFLDLLLRPWLGKQDIMVLRKYLLEWRRVGMIVRWDERDDIFLEFHKSKKNGYCDLSLQRWTRLPGGLRPWRSILLRFCYLLFLEQTTVKEEECDF